MIEHDCKTEVVTCQTCFREWCDKCHPTPSARCLFEYEHEPEDEQEPKAAYTITIANERDQVTLEWLAAHGYDARFLELANLLIVMADGRRIYTMTEPNAWEFREEIEDDPSAFMACNASDTLNTSLLQFEDSIV